MSSNLIQWIAFAVFLMLLVAAAAGEITWLKRKGWATPGRASAYVLSTDLLSLAIGSGFALICFFIMFMMVMGPAGRGGDSPSWAYAVTMALAIGLPLLLLLVSKRVGLAVFKMSTGAQAWKYSAVTTVIMFVVVVVPLPLFYYGASVIDGWTR